ncbi:MAG: NAD(P)/FAD-dependent oxidoreductase [Pleurocapsa sp. MO_226.B13]|nr:NAD(P)/FAD-dependent oxidoreductase [Pleurocapsa sp. MO_226.B13]
MGSGKIYDVLIVGAGPVGLATAIALRKRGINNLLVIDRTRSFRRVGQVVDLLPNGLKALKYIDEQAYQQVKATGLDFMQIRRQKSDGKEQKTPRKLFWCQKNLLGEVIRSIPLDFDFWFHRYGEGRISIPWYDLQTNLRNLLPSEIVKVNHRCVNFSQETAYVQVSCISGDEKYNNPFAHWEMQSLNQVTDVNSDNKQCERQQFQAKLVVAADGINSTIRQLIYTNSDLNQWAKPSYSGFVAIGCLEIDNISNEIIQELENKYFQGERVVTLRNDSLKSNVQNIDSPRLILIRLAENALGYLFHTPLSLDLLENKSPEAIINLAANILTKADFPPIFSQLIKLSNIEQLICRPYYIHPANIPHSQPIWSSERLVLVGDAAHGMPPFAAQGANQGLEDAAIIGTAISTIIDNNALDNQEIISHLFSKYEQLRRPFMEKIQEATMKNHNWSQTEWDSYSDAVYSRNVEDLISNFTA